MSGESVNAGDPPCADCSPASSRPSSGTSTIVNAPGPIGTAPQYGGSGSGNAKRVSSNQRSERSSSNARSEGTTSHPGGLLPSTISTGVTMDTASFSHTPSCRWASPPMLARTPT